MKKPRRFLKVPFKVSERLRFQRLSLLIILGVVFLLLGPLSLWFRSTHLVDYKSAQVRRNALETAFSFFEFSQTTPGLDSPEASENTAAELADIGQSALVQDPQLYAKKYAFLREHFELEEKSDPHLIPGTEKTLIFPPGSETARAARGIISFHGFMATRQEISPVIERVSERLGWPVFFSRVRHHGIRGDDLKDLDLADYIDAVTEAEIVGQHLAEQLVLVAVSTGAPMAILQAAQPNKAAQNIKSLILIAPNFGLPQWHWKLAAGPLGNIVGRVLFGGKYAWTPVNDEQGLYWTTKIHSDALRPMSEIVMLGLRAGKERKDWSDVSVLLVQNPLDKVLDNKAALDYLSQFKFKRFETYELSSPNHVLAGRIVSPENTEPLVQRIEEFLKKEEL